MDQASMRWRSKPRISENMAIGERPGAVNRLEWHSRASGCAAARPLRKPARPAALWGPGPARAAVGRRGYSSDADHRAAARAEQRWQKDRQKSPLPVPPGGWGRGPVPPSNSRRSLPRPAAHFSARHSTCFGSSGAGTHNCCMTCAVMRVASSSSSRVASSTPGVSRSSSIAPRLGSDSNRRIIPRPS